MRTWPRFALLLAVGLGGCSSDLTPPGPGRPEDVQQVRLFDGAGVEQAEHVFLFRSDTVHLETRMYAGDGHQITVVPGGVEASYRFVPDSLATSTAIAGEPLTRSVSTRAPVNTLGDLFVTLRFLADSSTRAFGPFQCLVHLHP
jgi:hypothetical protein